MMTKQQFLPSWESINAQKQQINSLISLLEQELIKRNPNWLKVKKREVQLSDLVYKIEKKLITCSLLKKGATIRICLGIPKDDPHLIIKGEVLAYILNFDPSWETHLEPNPQKPLYLHLVAK